MMYYGLRYRPAFVGAVPKGDYTVTEHPCFKYGVIAYPEPLSPDDVATYQLVPIVSIQHHAQLLIRRMGRFARMYAAKPEYIIRHTEQFFADDGVWSTGNKEALAAEVKSQLAVIDVDNE